MHGSGDAVKGAVSPVLGGASKLADMAIATRTPKNPPATFDTGITPEQSLLTNGLDASACDWPQQARFAGSVPDPLGRVNGN